MAGKVKPKKPRPDWPLFPHATGRWAKKIRGKFHYFGPWGDPDGALDRYLDQKDDLFAGRTPRVKGDGLTIVELVNRFLTSKKHALDAHEITEGTFVNYFECCGRLVGFFGRRRLVEDLAADDFEAYRAELAKVRGPASLSLEITQTKVVLKYAFDQAMIDTPVRYGQSFAKPSRRVMRRDRNSKPAKMFQSDELQAMIREAQQPLRAFIFLGLNCAFGPTDIARIPRAALDLETGWVEFQGVWGKGQERVGGAVHYLTQ